MPLIYRRMRSCYKDIEKLESTLKRQLESESVRGFKVRMYMRKGGAQLRMKSLKQMCETNFGVYLSRVGNGIKQKKKGDGSSQTQS